MVCCYSDTLFWRQYKHIWYILTLIPYMYNEIMFDCESTEFGDDRILEYIQLPPSDVRECPLSLWALAKVVNNVDS